LWFEDVVLRNRHYFYLLHQSLSKLFTIQYAEGSNGRSKIASNPRISVTKRSQFFKKTEVQTKASFELSLPHVPLFYPSARSQEGTVWYTLLNLKGNFQQIFHCHFLVQIVHWTLILPPFPVIFSKSLKIIFFFFYIPLRVFENRVLRRILGPKRDELTEKWRLHNEERKDLYCSPNIVRVIIS